jgi:hypothetical protein
MSLDGLVRGHTLTLSLDPLQTSTGGTSITDLGDGFSINSFFDVFVELSFDSNPPLTASRGPLRFTTTSVGAVPEPATWAMMLLGFLGIGFLACRNKSTLRLA